ncbi:trypsin-like peptidase domain-containing protein [Parageobacillus sp. VR-IP]|uniref:trypsin-like peptidase domain-containing protein n=1 Tax=Parageobacillus sp. VR-IP TaxID=2742205 RepID=UPI0015844049|nr:trypsin-like peptidase domain-containing protein [Parageobacillus sp. VR-IP]NUK29800.1 trypsin-like peptidase domain-containing protein [Parageobacillus sp. VR-IP]
MYCAKCGNKTESGAKFCSNCGASVRPQSNKLLVMTAIFMFVVCVSIWTALVHQWRYDEKKTEEVASKPIEQVKKERKTPVEKVKSQTAPAAKATAANTNKDVTKIIAEAQEKVFTIYTGYSQGSGFLINKQGDVLTNAHVVEGSIDVMVRDRNGEEFQGKVIGYSNDIDVAVVRVPALKNKSPLLLETTRKAQVGEEVITLGSPMGLENTATFGYISGVDRNFVIEPHIYEDVYQISAPMAPGNSGGPLLERKTGKVLAINSARHATEANIGFSIPIFKIYSLIQKWISSPLAEDEIYAMFYNNEGMYFYQSLEGEGYFEGGDYSEAYDTYDVWNYDEQESETDSEYENDDESDAIEENVEMDDSIDGSNISEEESWHEEEINDEPTDEKTDLEEEPSDGEETVEDHELNESESYEGEWDEGTTDESPQDQSTDPSTDQTTDQPMN